MIFFRAAGLELQINPTTFGMERIAILRDASSFCFVKGKTFALPSGNNFLIEKELSRPDSIRAKFLYFSDITAEVTVDEYEEAVRLRYVFRNEGKASVSWKEGELGVFFPFNDTYDIPRVTLKRRVHSFVRTAGETYILTRRVSGEPYALALLMTKGSCNSYRTELSAFSKDRGEISLNVPEMTLDAGATYEWEFMLFSYADETDFAARVSRYGRINARADTLTPYEGESVVVRSTGAERLTTDDAEYPFLDGECRFIAKGEGEKSAVIHAGEEVTTLHYYVLREDIFSRRRVFLTGEQESLLSSCGKKLGGRIKSEPHFAEKELAAFAFLMSECRLGRADEYAVGELLGRFSGCVDEAGDALFGKDADVDTLSLFVSYCYERYLFEKDLTYLLASATVLRRIFEQGIPALPTSAAYVIQALREEKKDALCRELTEQVTAAADSLLSAGNQYSDKGTFTPFASCGAVSLLSVAYTCTQNEYYKTNAEEHIKVMDAFSASSLDYRTNNLPQLLGRDEELSLTYDMSPNVKAVYFALAYHEYAWATGKDEYEKKARDILRALMTLFDSLGGAKRGVPIPSDVNHIALAPEKQISYGEDIILYSINLLFQRN